MKKLIIVAACMVASVAAYAQGTVTFGNLNPVNDVGGSPALGSAFQAELYAGPTGGSLTAIASSITPFIDAAPGFFFNAVDVAIPGVATGESADVMVKVWKISDGATYEIASTKPLAHIGSSVKFSAGPLGGGGPPPLPGASLNMPGFNLTIVPEPSTIALGLLGVGALLLRRRK
jgi:hypothetical protein